MPDSPASRLREEREHLGLSQKAAGELGGVSKNTQLAYETGTSPITLDYLGRLGAHGLDVGYVATGKRFSAGGRSTIPKKVGERSDIVEVAEIDLRFGLGGAYMDEQAVPHMRSFSTAWLRQITPSPPEELYWARGQGNSMEPTIGDGDILLIDRSQVTPGFGDLYWAIAFGQIGMIKRLRPMPDGSVKILSDNAAVPPEVAVDDELHIFGRVIAIVKNI